MFYLSQVDNFNFLPVTLDASKFVKPVLKGLTTISEIRAESGDGEEVLFEDIKQF